MEGVHSLYLRRLPAQSRLRGAVARRDKGRFPLPDLPGNPACGAAFPFHPHALALFSLFHAQILICPEVVAFREINDDLFAPESYLKIWRKK